MAHNVLVITPQPQFGEMIRLTLEETGLYRVRLVQNGTAALASCNHTSFDLSILDFDLRNESSTQLTLNLRAAQGGLKIVIIPPGNNPRHPLLADLNPDGFIYQPFYVPEMLETIASVLECAQPESEPQAAGVSSPAWLDDLTRTRTALSQLFPFFTAQAGLLVRGKDAWCSTGAIGSGAAQEIAVWLARYTSGETHIDLARYLHLNSDSSDVLVYAVSIASGVMLALVYPPGTALSKISIQTRQLAQQLTQQLMPTTIEPPTPLANPPVEPEAPILTAVSVKAPAELALEAFLNQLPSPEPQPEPESNVSFLFPWELEPACEIAPPEQKPVPMPVEVIPEGPTPERLLLSNPPNSIEDTQPVRLRETEEISEPGVVSAPLPNPIYTCILLPRQPEHTLSGVVADHLTHWIPQLCLAFSWEMVNLEVNPDFLEWQVQLAPAVSPGNVVRIIRKLSSQRLFNLNPRFQNENPSGDFWAPGFLIISGAEPPSPLLVREHIQQTRRRQGMIS